MIRLAHCLPALALALRACAGSPTPATLPTPSPQLPTEAPSPTPSPSPSPEPTSTTTQTPPPTETTPPEGAALGIMATMLEAHTDIEEVLQAELAEGVLELEILIKYATKDLQPRTSFDIVRLLVRNLIVVKGGTAEPMAAAGLSVHSIVLTTVSGDRHYRYHTSTDWALMQELYQGSLNYLEWAEAAGGQYTEGD